jgi:hypothetical protein
MRDAAAHLAGTDDAYTLYVHDHGLVVDEAVAGPDSLKVALEILPASLPAQ